MHDIEDATQHWGYVMQNTACQSADTLNTIRWRINPCTAFTWTQADSSGYNSYGTVETNDNTNLYYYYLVTPFRPSGRALSPNDSGL